mmetsp:Transcript_19105/g.39353  ORF Transcript_19105/g.39353 Transcript_19105/m.39353 type:complete len:277 (-) Transcript_19105:175-1005(-)
MKRPVCWLTSFSSRATSPLRSSIELCRSSRCRHSERSVSVDSLSIPMASVMSKLADFTCPTAVSTPRARSFTTSFRPCAMRFADSSMRRRALNKDSSSDRPYSCLDTCFRSPAISSSAPAADSPNATTRSFWRINALPLAISSCFASNCPRNESYCSCATFCLLNALTSFCRASNKSFTSLAKAAPHVSMSRRPLWSTNAYPPPPTVASPTESSDSSTRSCSSRSLFTRSSCFLLLSLAASNSSFATSSCDRLAMSSVALDRAPSAPSSHSTKSSW